MFSPICVFFLMVATCAFSVLAGYHFRKWEEREQDRKRIVMDWIKQGAGSTISTEHSLRTNEAFEKYRKQMLDNLGEDAQSFSNWLNARDATADKAAFDEWQAHFAKTYRGRP